MTAPPTAVMAAISRIGPLSSPKGAAYRHDPDVDWRPADSIKFRFSGNAGPLCGGPAAARRRQGGGVRPDDQGPQAGGATSQRAIAAEGGSTWPTFAAVNSAHRPICVSRSNAVSLRPPVPIANVWNWQIVLQKSNRPAVERHCRGIGPDFKAESEPKAIPRV